MASDLLQAIAAAGVGLDDALVAVRVLMLVGSEWLRNRALLPGWDPAQITAGYLTGCRAFTSVSEPGPI